MSCCCSSLPGILFLLPFCFISFLFLFFFLVLFSLKFCFSHFCISWALLLLLLLLLFLSLSLSFCCCHFCTVASVFFLLLLCGNLLLLLLYHSFFFFFFSLSLWGFCCSYHCIFCLFSFFFPVFLWLFCYKQPAALFVWFLFLDFVAWALQSMQTCSCTPTAAVFLFLKWVTVLFCRWSCFGVRTRKNFRTTSTTYILRERHSLSGFFCVLKERRILQHILQLSWKQKTKQKKFVNLPSTPIFRYNIQKVTNCKRTVEEEGGGSGGYNGYVSAAIISFFFFFFDCKVFGSCC